MAAHVDMRKGIASDDIIQGVHHVHIKLAFQSDPSVWDITYRNTTTCTGKQPESQIQMDGPMTERLLSNVTKWLLEVVEETKKEKNARVANLSDAIRYSAIGIIGAVTYRLGPTL